MVDRNFILDRIRSKRVSIDEFNFDKLDAPPIAAYFSQFDIANLNQIAKSLKYSARPKEKYEAIDKIMRSRGFQKLSAGTNRICYRCLDDNRFVAKVAYDAVGIGDNPREFRNQFLLKPFVTKIFEVTPCGTLAFAEKVEPITSREEFISMAEDIFTVINDWFIGRYVMEDIGVNYFCNWSCRKSFGPVLLDFPYLYELDGNKLYCNAPDINSPSGCCDGEIDYDDGFNKLICKKCGAHYKAVELSKDIKDSKVIIRKQGDVRMKISLKGGSNNTAKTVTTGEYADHAKSIPNSSGMKISLKGSSVAKKEEEDKQEFHSAVFTMNGDSAPVEEPNNDDMFTEEEKQVISVAEANIIKEIREEEKEVVEETPRMISPIIFAPEEKADDKTKFYDLVKELSEMVHNCDKYGLDENIVKDTLSGCFGSLIKSADNKEMISAIGVINNNLVDYANDVDEEVIEAVLPIWLRSKYVIVAERVDNITYSREHEALTFSIVPIIRTAEFMNNNSDEEFIPRTIYTEDTEFNIGFPFKDIVSQLSNIGYKMVEADSSSDVFEYGNTPKYFSGTIKKLSEIFVDNDDSDNVILIQDEYGNYLTTGEDNNIIAIDTIDGKTVNGIEIVSKEWLNNSVITNALEKTGALPPTSEETDENSESDN